MGPRSAPAGSDTAPHPGRALRTRRPTQPRSQTRRASWRLQYRCERPRDRNSVSVTILVPCALLRLNASILEQLGVTLRVVLEDHLELIGRVGEGKRALLLELLHHVGHLQNSCDVLADLVEDRLGRVRRRHDRKPGIVFVAWHPGFRDRRQVRPWLHLLPPWYGQHSLHVCAH